METADVAIARLEEQVKSLVLQFKGLENKIDDLAKALQQGCAFGRETRFHIAHIEKTLEVIEPRLSALEEFQSMMKGKWAAIAVVGWIVSQVITLAVGLSWGR